ncbi:hypothetical protein O3M35_001063 [Rhynocoris fuscipes]|uniref:Uncharacterized protein n=1 Tax=Rhynocoris fuscipes TaxID=488301 RepID=A0AAW1DNU6_9HEMI
MIEFERCVLCFMRYGGHKIRNFELLCWQHCWSDCLKFLYNLRTAMLYRMQKVAS